MVDPLIFYIVLSLVLLNVDCQQQQQQQFIPPGVLDYSLQYWPEGFPGVHTRAPWLRVYQTGYYAFVLNTQFMQVPYFGRLSSQQQQQSYYYAAKDTTNTSWALLPPANLVMTFTNQSGTVFTCTAAANWTNLLGPRVIDAGRFVQRSDVTDLVFTSSSGDVLNMFGRFETHAWPDSLSLILELRPKLRRIDRGELSFGRVGGGYGLVATNTFVESRLPSEIDPPIFTLEAWVFPPKDFAVAANAYTWIICRGWHEHADGNYGFMLLPSGVIKASLNIGGGSGNFSFVQVNPKPVNLEAWNLLTMTYNGNQIDLYLNGSWIGKTAIAAPKQTTRTQFTQNVSLTFGKRGDTTGYEFTGIIDEVRIYDYALSASEVLARYQNPSFWNNTNALPKAYWGFNSTGNPRTFRESENFENVSYRIAFETAEKSFSRSLDSIGRWESSVAKNLGLTINMRNMEQVDTAPEFVNLSAIDVPSGKSMKISFDPLRNLYDIDASNLVCQFAPSQSYAFNDAMEQMRFNLSNFKNTSQIFRIMFSRTKYPSGSPVQFVTGVVAFLTDLSGEWIGIPVQISKNWHALTTTEQYASVYFHGYSMIEMPANSSINLLIKFVYAHFGGIPSVSHAQLSLIGWGSNQLWDQSAMGAWGESICYESDGIQSNAVIKDVRPLMVTAMHQNFLKWHWTNNVGGGDYLRLFETATKLTQKSGMKNVYTRQGPCLTEVTYHGKLSRYASHSFTSSLARSNDFLKVYYRIQMNVTEAFDFTRFVIYQIGADSYSISREKKFAYGNENGLENEWNTTYGNSTYRRINKLSGLIPWVSLHDCENTSTTGPVMGALANRGFILRSWDAKIGGVSADPWIAEIGFAPQIGLKSDGGVAIMDLIPPPNVRRFLAGDYIDVMIESIVIPQRLGDYYGPNENLRDALGKPDWSNTWRMVLWESNIGHRNVSILSGELLRIWPTIEVNVSCSQEASFTVTGTNGYLPTSFSGLSSYSGYELRVNGTLLNQSIFGKDFWQVDYDEDRKSWTRTYNVLLPMGLRSTISFAPIIKTVCKTPSPTSQPTTSSPTIQPAWHPTTAPSVSQLSNGPIPPSGEPTSGKAAAIATGSVFGFISCAAVIIVIIRKKRSGKRRTTSNSVSSSAQVKVRTLTCGF